MQLTTNKKITIGLSFSNVKRKNFNPKNITTYFLKCNQDSIHIVLQKHSNKQ